MIYGYIRVSSADQNEIVPIFGAGFLFGILIL